MRNWASYMIEIRLEVLHQERGESIGNSSRPMMRHACGWAVDIVEVAGRVVRCSGKGRIGELPSGGRQRKLMWVECRVKNSQKLIRASRLSDEGTCILGEGHQDSC